MTTQIPTAKQLALSSELNRRAIPTIVRQRGLLAIQDWLQTDRGWLETYGCSYHGFREKGNRPNVIGFWRKYGTGYLFRPLKTLKIGESVSNIA